MENEIIRQKSNFLIIWIFANSIGLGYAWPLSELIWRYLGDASNVELGKTIAVIVFECLLWIVRGGVLVRYRSYKLIKPLQVSIWIGTELIGWVLSQAPIQEGGLLGVSTGAIFATAVGEIMWLIFMLLTMPNRQRKTWELQAILWTFLGMVGGSILLAIFLTFSLELGEQLAEMSSPLLGMTLAGTVFGGLLGLVSGMSLIKMMRWEIIDTE